MCFSSIHLFIFTHSSWDEIPNLSGIFNICGQVVYLNTCSMNRAGLLLLAPVSESAWAKLLGFGVWSERLLDFILLLLWMWCGYEEPQPVWPFSVSRTVQIVMLASFILSPMFGAQRSPPCRFCTALPWRHLSIKQCVQKCHSLFVLFFVLWCCVDVAQVSVEM